MTTGAGKRPAKADGQKAMPLFYEQAHPVNAERHGDWKLKGKPDFRFAAKAAALPLMAEEFAAAAPFYPVVFTAGKRPAAVAVVGVRQGRNLFVDEAGQWRAGTYLPAYVRRYPFIFLENPGEERLVLCIDEAGGLVGPDGDRPLFENGKPTEAVENALKFCAAFRQQSVATQDFVDALREHDLLVEQKADIAFKSGERAQVNGFMMIDVKKFDALPDDVFLDWRRKGWLALVYMHFLSLPRFAHLADLAG